MIPVIMYHRMESFLTSKYASGKCEITKFFHSKTYSQSHPTGDLSSPAILTEARGEQLGLGSGRC